MRKLGIGAGLIVLSGCYVQFEDTDVSYRKESVCGTPSSCPSHSQALTFASHFMPMVPVELGNSGLLTNSESKQGPVTFNGSMLVNQLVLTMTTPADGSFSGLRAVELRAAIGKDTCAQLSATCPSLASYDSARDGVADKKLVLKGSGANLLDIAGPEKRLALLMRAVGNAPASPSWNGDLELSVLVKSRGGFP
jgi:hypothetical protein